MNEASSMIIRLIDELAKPHLENLSLDSSCMILFNENIYPILSNVRDRTLRISIKDFKPIFWSATELKIFSSESLAKSWWSGKVLGKSTDISPSYGKEGAFFNSSNEILEFYFYIFEMPPNIGQTLHRRPVGMPFLILSLSFLSFLDIRFARFGSI